MADASVNYDKSKHFHSTPGWTADEMIGMYKTRAPVYDQQMAYMVYTGPDRTVKEVMEYFPDQKDIRIIDCGAGTGIVAEKLREQGYMDIDGVDASQDMLDQAMKKGVYRRYICDFLGPNRLDIEDNTYDCTIGAGLICPSQASTDCFPELIRITKPGGIIILSCRQINILNDPFLKENYEPTIQRLHDEGTWKLIKREMVPNFLHDFEGNLTVMEVL